VVWFSKTREMEEKEQVKGIQKTELFQRPILREEKGVWNIKTGKKKM